MIGRVCNEIAVRTLPTGSITTDFTLAVDRRRRESGADFIKCTAWGKSAELLEAYVGKGEKVGIIGHIVTGQYTNRDGAKVYTTKITVDELEFLGGRHGDTAEAQPESTEASTEQFIEVTDDDELPF